MSYRLYIDIPLGSDEKEAVNTVNNLMRWCFSDDRHQVDKMKLHGVSQVNYRLGYDEDRKKSNYLDKNENGHVSNKKTKMKLV